MKKYGFVLIIIALAFAISLMTGEGGPSIAYYVGSLWGVLNVAIFEALE